VFADEWVRQVGWPVVRVDVTYDPATSTATVSGEQVQPAEHGTYTLTGALAVPVHFVGLDGTTCVARLSFAAGTTSDPVEVACPFPPFELDPARTAADVLVEVLPLQ
jgi:hypothetical protein